jgi:hypothetical protein
MEKDFIKVVCIDESDPLEYKVLEDKNVGSLKELFQFLDKKYPQHIENGIRWLLLPSKITI